MKRMNHKSKFPFSNDWSVLEKCGRVRVKGKIRAIYDDQTTKFNVPPLGDHYTVTLKPSDNPTYYMKFRTKEELKALPFAVGENVDVEGDLTKYSRRGVTKHILSDVKLVR